MKRNFVKVFSLLFLATLALGLSTVLSGCASSSGHESEGVALRWIAFYPEGSVLVNNKVMDSTKTVEVSRITAVDVQKSESPVKFVLVGADKSNKLYILNNTWHTVVGWENGADYSKYAKIGTDRRSINYVSSTSMVMNLIASYQSTNGATPVREFLQVTTSDGSEQIKAIEFYPAGATIDEDNPNKVVDSDGFELSPIDELVVSKYDSPVRFVAVAVFASNRGILTNTEHVLVDWEDGVDYDKYAVIGTDNRSVYFVKENFKAMPLVVDYYRDLKAEKPTVTNTLKVYTVED